jgi:long-chain acyl-CoA synthetase
MLAKASRLFEIDEVAAFDSLIFRVVHPAPAPSHNSGRDQRLPLFIADRRTDLILSGGVNIYPAEIEHMLMAMPGVSDCAVFGIPDPEFGQAIVAVVKVTHDRALSQGEVQQYLASRLANFKVPRIIDFRDELPREDTGKIFKRRLQEEYSALRQASA